MVIVMNMSSYAIEREIVEAEYAREESYSGRQSASAQLQLQPFVSTHEKRRTLPADLATVNVELFLRRM